MEKPRFSNMLGILVMLTSFAFITSCDKDDDGVSDPAGTITINMLNEQNGKTVVAGLYINKANNLYSDDSYTKIADAGKASGIGTRVTPKLDNLAREVAATPGHIYQVFRSQTTFDFPSKVKALRVNTSYYHLYVVSPLFAEDENTGAIVKYATVFSDTKDLPEYEHILGSVRNYEDEVSLKLPKGAECYWDSKEESVFQISTDNRTLKITLISPDWNGELHGNHPFYIRVGEVYTMIYVNVESPR